MGIGVWGINGENVKGDYKMLATVKGVVQRNRMCYGESVEMIMLAKPVIILEFTIEDFKLNNEPYDFLIIATSYENPLS